MFGGMKVNKLQYILIAIETIVEAVNIWLLISRFSIFRLVLSIILGAGIILQLVMLLGWLDKKE